MRTTAGVLGLMMVASCSRSGTDGKQAASGTPAASSAPPAAAAARAPIKGHLEIWQDGLEFAYERYEDDGKTLKSEVFIGDSTGVVTITRSPRHFTADEFTHDVPDGAFPQWQGGRIFGQKYAILAEWFADAATKTPIKLIGPPKFTPVDGSVLVAPEGDGKRVELGMPWGTITAHISPEGAVTSWSTDDKSGKEALSGTSPPAGVDEELVEVDREGLKVRGSLWMPRGKAGPWPVVIMIAGSGPTDRDCNSILALRTNAFRMIAEELAKRGIASLRFDKRGVGQSGKKVDPEKLVVGDFAGDAAALVDLVRKDKRFGAVTLAGHSEGGLIALLATEKSPPDALLFVNSLGRTFSTVLREQYARQVTPAMMKEFDRVLDDIRKGKAVPEVPAFLAPVFNKSVQGYVRSEMDMDPGVLLGKLKVPALVLQGETDAQTSADDAKNLGSKRPDVKVVMLPRTNHVLKEEADRGPGQLSYNDSTKPLAPGFFEAFLTGVALAAAPPSTPPDKH